MARSKTREAFESRYGPAALRMLFDERISSSRAVGRDGTRPDVFARTIDPEIEVIRRKVFSQTYAFTRYRDRLISKGAGKKPRLLSIPTVRDRLTLRALCEFLGEIYKEALIKKPHSYIKQISDLASRAVADDVFIKIDIEDYYGSISKELLIRTLKRKIRIPEAISIISKAISTPTLKIGETENGIPQGLSISNILASIYLMDVDTKMSSKWSYFRYVDDILVVAKQDQVDQVLTDLVRLLRKKSSNTIPLERAASRMWPL
jgi:retron-type reverse transcriptase